MLLSKLSKFSTLTSSLAGADKVIRLLAYVLKLVSSWLQWKAHQQSLSSSDLFKASVIIHSMKKLYSFPHNALLLTKLESKQTAGPHPSFPDSASLELAGKLDALVASLMETRSVLRLFGTASSILDLHATSSALAAHLKTLSLSNRDLYPALASWLQSLTMMFYYPCDHLYWLWSKGAVKSMAEATANRISQWSCRGWAAYILLDLALMAKELCDTYQQARHATSKPFPSSDTIATSPPPIPEPFDDSMSLHTSGELLDAPSLVSLTSTRSPGPPSDRLLSLEAIRADPKLRDWALRFLIHLGDLPLALHWSFDSCQLSSMTVALCGTLSSSIGLYRKWTSS